MTCPCGPPPSAGPYNGRVPGTLYVVATPIGNLSDMSPRAIETLRGAAWIACEDTRQTRKLLEHFGIASRTVSYHEHNEAERSEELLRRLEKGESVALVSDAGTPLISDPGYRLVKKAAERGIPVVPVPGPTAAMAALSASGLETDRFYFGGFLPRKSAERRRMLEQLRGLDATLIFYEAPHRLMESLRDVEALLGSRPLVVAREVTKLHEEFLRGAPEQILAELERRGDVRGEVTLLIGRGKAEAAAGITDQDLRREVERLERAGLARMDAIKRVARECGLPKREVYRAVEDRR